LRLRLLVEGAIVVIGKSRPLYAGGAFGHRHTIKPRGPIGSVRAVFS